MDDWDKLSPQQRAKVRGIACNNWSDIEVYLQGFDDRESSESKLNYGTILIIFKVGGVEHHTTISQQVNGRER